MESNFVIAALIANGGRVRQTAATLKVDESTLYRLLRDEKFCREYACQKQQLLSETIDTMQSYLLCAVETVVSIMQDDTTNPQIRLNACQTLLQAFHRMNEQYAIIQRVEELERTATNADT